MKAICVTKNDFDAFLKKYSKGTYGPQLLGEAFYDEFRLHNVANQSSLMNIWSKTGDHAIRSIRENILGKEFCV